MSSGFSGGIFLLSGANSPLIGCLCMDIVGLCPNQSEARILVADCYRILTRENPGSVRQRLACIHQSEAKFIRLSRSSTTESLLDNDISLFVRRDNIT